MGLFSHDCCSSGRLYMWNLDSYFGGHCRVMVFNRDVPLYTRACEKLLWT